MNKKIVVVGWDGMPPEIAFDLWIDKLPNLKKMVMKGSHGQLESTVPYVTATAWASFATGQNPGKTSIFDFLVPNKTLLDIRPVSSRDIKSKTFYEVLKSYNKKSILINLPLSHPPKTNDIMITSFLTQGDNFIYPESLLNEYKELQNYQVMPRPELMIDLRDSDKNSEKLAQECRRVENKRFDIAKKLFKDKQWDLFFVMFSSSDTLQHKNHADIMRGDVTEESEIFKLFQDLDSYLGWFMENLPAETVLMLLSDHGFKKYKGKFYINNYLVKKGWSKLKADTKTKKIYATTSQKERGELIDKNKERFRAINSRKLLQFLYNHPIIFRLSKRCYYYAKKILPVKTNVSLDLDVKETKVAFIKGTFQGVYLNFAKRFNDGTLKDEKEYNELKQSIITDLKNLEDPGGNKIFSNVLPREEVYKGPFLEAAPDLLVELKDYLLSPKITLGKLYNEQEENGHSKFGIFCAYGPSIKEEHKLDQAKLIDVAPTILSFFELDAPYALDGQKLRIFKD